MVVVYWDSITKGSNVIIADNKLTTTNSDNSNTVRATHGVSSGKWYWEITIDSGSYFFVGIVNESADLNTRIFDTNSARYIYSPNGSKYPEGTTYSTAYGVGDVLGIALDMNIGSLTYYKNGVSLGVSHTNLLSMGKVYPSIGSGGAVGTVTANFGATPFSYTIPSGFQPYGEREPFNKILLSSNEKTYSLEKGKLSENLIPNMTSNTTPSGVASASHEGNPAWRAFSDTTVSWNPPSGVVADTWIQYKFDSPVRIRKYDISTASSSGTTRGVKDFKFQGSNDGVNYIDLDVRNGVTWSANNELKSFSCDNNNYFIYYRLFIISNNGNAFVVVGNFSMYDLTETSLKSLPSHSEQNLIKYGMDSPVQVDEIFTNKKYILQDTVSEDVNGLWTTKINRKPLSIKFN